jgi:4a-hydroxytetrahydrobiopterin dehydratase
MSAPPPGWRAAGNALHARFSTGDFASGLRFVNAIGAAAEEADHHPDIDLRYGHVEVHLWSHDAGGVTRRDHRLATRISELAAEAGLEAS